MEYHGVDNASGEQFKDQSRVQIKAELLKNNNFVKTFPPFFFMFVILNITLRFNYSWKRLTWKIYMKSEWNNCHCLLFICQSSQINHYDFIEIKKIGIIFKSDKSNQPCYLQLMKFWDFCNSWFSSKEKFT